MSKNVGPVQVVFHIFDLKKGPITEQHKLPNEVKAKAFAMDNLFREGLTGITFYYPSEHSILAEHYKVDYLDGGLRSLTRVIPRHDLFEKGGEDHA